MRYVLVEPAGWNKEKGGDLMISGEYIADPIPPNGQRAVTFAVKYVKGVNCWTGSVVKIECQ
jgi:hypothetical protein